MGVSSVAAAAGGAKPSGISRLAASTDANLFNWVTSLEHGAPVAAENRRGVFYRICVAR